jgi:hypothetical protein
MKNERGEVVTGVLVVTMVVVMVFGMFFMRGGHGGHCSGNGNEQRQYADNDQRQMHDGAAEKDSVLAEKGEK